MSSIPSFDFVTPAVICVAGVNMPAPAVYEAISSGVTDGVFFPMETMYAFKIAELAKHTYSNPQGMKKIDRLRPDHERSDKAMTTCRTRTRTFSPVSTAVLGLTGVECRAASAPLGRFRLTRSALRSSRKIAELGWQADMSVASAADQAYFAEKTVGMKAKVVAVSPMSVVLLASICQHQLSMRPSHPASRKV